MNIIVARGVKMEEKYQSIFDIVGPVMVGPSSSHTAGAAKLGKKAGQLLKNRPQKIRIDYYESFAKTHVGHGTDLAIVGGILGMDADNPALANSLEIIKAQAISLQINELSEPSPIGHPNTAAITLSDGKNKIFLCGCSIGGGKIEVKQIELDGYNIELPGSLPVILFKCSPRSLVKILEKLSDMGSIVTAQNFCHFAERENLYALNLKEMPVNDLERKIQKYCDNLICL